MNQVSAQRSVWKFPIVIDAHQVVTMPRFAKILYVAYQGPTLCIWALVDPDALPVKRRILVAGTGHARDDLAHADYVGTILLNQDSLVFHIFDGGEA